MDVRSIPAEATHDLRRRVLRPDQRAGELARPGDDDPRTAHFGCYHEGRLVSIATMMPEAEPGGPGDWRLRGVATEPDEMGRGFGTLVIRACLDHARSMGGRTVWLNGRVTSRGFYEMLGFTAEGAPFDTPPTGPHLRFRMDLSAASR